MSYWSLRRAADRAATAHELARTTEDAAPRTRIKLPDWTPSGQEQHPATVTSPGRSLRQRAADLERALWTVPSEPDPVSAGVSGRSSW